MAKRNKNKNRKRSKSSGKMVMVPNRQVKSVPRGLYLDDRAAKYAALLADPCNGPLVSGPFGDSGGGLISRFESDFVINTGATETGSFLAFVPGSCSTYVSTTAITTDSVSFVTGNSSSSNAPGYGFLNSNSVQFRCLSACLQVYFPGTELNRSGITSLGQSAEGLVYLTLTTSQVRSASQYVERTPESSAEIVWRPNNFDLEWTYPTGDGTTATSAKRSALVATVAGLPLATGLRYRLVAVYEWMPVVNEGLVAPMNRGMISSNTFQDVVRKLDSLGDWMYHGALAVGKAGSSIYRGVRAIGQVAYGTAKLAAIMAG